MPLRLPPLLQLHHYLHHPITPTIHSSNLYRNSNKNNNNNNRNPYHPHSQQPNQTKPFHTSSTSDQQNNHYTTLESNPHATQPQLKKQFYTLSKKFHPDLHPEDASASARFIRISTAWAVLGNAATRATYDRDLAQSDPFAFSAGAGGNYHGGRGRGSSAPVGSHSSAQAYGGGYGARPASGLSKRRGQFRGPPPSFYRSGGWGGFGEKRRGGAEWARDDAHTAAAAANANASADTGTGTGTGTNESQATSGAQKKAGQSQGYGFGFGSGFGYPDNDVPHFDREDHFRRQESVEEGMRRRRRRQQQQQHQQHLHHHHQMGEGGLERDSTPRREVEESSVLGRVMIVSAALVFTGVVGAVWEKRKTRKRKN